MIEQLLHIAAIGAASHRLFFNLFNLFWLLLSMTFNVIAETQCSCHLALPTHGWHISVSIVLVSHTVVSLRLNFMPQWPGSQKKTRQFNKLTSENILRLPRSTKTPALWLKAVWRTPLRAALLLAKHGTLGSTTWASKFSALGETKKSTIFKGMLLLIPLHLQG